MYIREGTYIHVVLCYGGTCGGTLACKQTPSNDEGIFKKTVMKAVTDNEDVLFHWCMLTAKINDKDARQSLFRARS